MLPESRATFLTSRTSASKRPARRHPPGSRRLYPRPYARNLAQAPVAKPTAKSLSLESLPPEFRQMQTSVPVAAIVGFGSVRRHRQLTGLSEKPGGDIAKYSATLRT